MIQILLIFITKPTYYECNFTKILPTAEYKIVDFLDQRGKNYKNKHTSHTYLRNQHAIYHWDFVYVYALPHPSHTSLLSRTQ